MIQRCQNCGIERRVYFNAKDMTAAAEVVVERCGGGDSGAHDWRNVVQPAVEMFDSRTANRIVAWLEAQGLIGVATMLREGAWRHEG